MLEQLDSLSDGPFLLLYTLYSMFNTMTCFNFID